MGSEFSRHPMQGVWVFRVWVFETPRGSEFLGSEDLSFRRLSFRDTPYQQKILTLSVLKQFPFGIFKDNFTLPHQNVKTQKKTHTKKKRKRNKKNRTLVLQTKNSYFDTRLFVADVFFARFLSWTLELISKKLTSTLTILFFPSYNFFYPLMTKMDEWGIRKHILVSKQVWIFMTTFKRILVSTFTYTFLLLKEAWNINFRRWILDPS